MVRRSILEHVSKCGLALSDRPSRQMSTSPHIVSIPILNNVFNSEDIMLVAILQLLGFSSWVLATPSMKSNSSDHTREVFFAGGEYVEFKVCDMS